MADSSAPTIKAVGFRTVVLMRYFKKFFEREEGFYMGYHNIVILYIGYFFSYMGFHNTQSKLYITIAY